MEYSIVHVLIPLDIICGFIRRSWLVSDSGGFLEDLFVPSKNRNGKSYCSSHRIHEEVLDAAVQEFAQTMRVKMAEKQKELKQRAELKQLQEQINPHFLMNTLSNIKYMAMILKSNTIVDCITALGNILSPIYRSNEQEWSVEEEMRYIDNYVKVMNYRFGGKIQIHYQVCQEDKQARVLRFILQPLIENSILHGFENTSEEKKILVSIHERDGGWIVAVKDNGSGMDEERLRRLRESVTQPEELTQETFYQAMKNWKRYEGKSSVGTWLCAIARNQFLRVMRKQSPLPLDNVPEASVPDFTEMVAEHSFALSAHQALHRLPEPYREVFTLKTFCELSSKEIAALFGKSESWARVTVYRAKQMLLDAMKGDETHEERL